MTSWTYQLRAVDWSSNPPTIEKPEFEEYRDRLEKAGLLEGRDKNAVGKCWLRSMFPNATEKDIAK